MNDRLSFMRFLELGIGDVVGSCFDLVYGKEGEKRRILLEILAAYRDECRADQGIVAATSERAT